MYTDINFKTKKAFRDAINASNAYIASPDTAPKAQPVTYFQPGPFGPSAPADGVIYVEGPHYPEPHKWYAQCEAKDGKIVRIIK
jgi:hypothetical protein